MHGSFRILAVMAVWEVIAPRLAPTVFKSMRWVSNLDLVFLNSVDQRLLFPAAAVGVATLAQEGGRGHSISMIYLLAASGYYGGGGFCDLSAACDGPRHPCVLAPASGLPC